MADSVSTRSRSYEESVPSLQGFLVDETERQVKIAVPHGAWLISRDDVVSIAEWENPIGNLDGRPVEATIRPGAQIDFLQSVKVATADRPLTLTDSLSEIVGRRELDEMARSWAGRMGFDLVQPGGESSPSACCWETGTWGMECQPDDCMD